MNLVQIEIGNEIDTVLTQNIACLDLYSNNNYSEKQFPSYERATEVSTEMIAPKVSVRRRPIVQTK